MSTCVWRNKITLPPCFNAAQTCSSSACACPVESVSRTNRQRSKEAVRLIEWVSMGHLGLLLSLPHKYVRYWPLADIPSVAFDVAFGGKAALPWAIDMSCFDPKRTSASLTTSSSG